MYCSSEIRINQLTAMSIDSIVNYLHHLTRKYNENVLVPASQISLVSGLLAG